MCSVDGCLIATFQDLTGVSTSYRDAHFADIGGTYMAIACVHFFPHTVHDVRYTPKLRPTCAQCDLTKDTDPNMRLLSCHDMLEPTFTGTKLCTCFWTKQTRLQTQPGVHVLKLTGVRARPCISREVALRVFLCTKGISNRVCSF